MVDCVLRGSCFGVVSYEIDCNYDLVLCQIVWYCIDNGEEFEVLFVDDVEIFGIWLCCNGMEGILIEGDLFELKKVKLFWMYWDMLLECCFIEEFEELFKECFEFIWLCWCG